MQGIGSRVKRGVGWGRRISVTGTHGYQGETSMPAWNMDLETGSGLLTSLRRKSPEMTSAEKALTRDRI